MGKITTRSISALLLCAVLAGGCDTLLGPDDEDVLMPLAVGNMWIGTATTYTGSGSTSVTDTLEIVAEESIGGETWFVAADGRRFINRSDGLQSVEPIDPGCAACACDGFTGKYPARSGDSAIIAEPLVIDPSSNEPVKLTLIDRVVSTDTTIRTGSGTYAVHHYRTEIARNLDGWLVTPESRFYKPGLGPVRFERGGDKVTWRWDLVRAVIK